MLLPLVSIIVVSYNHSKFIRESLDSIKKQTYKNIELIVADDASKDNSVEVFDAWLAESNYPAKKNFHTKNTGLATTLNECIDLATGDYIKVIAADDFLHPESIEKCVGKLEELGEEYGMVYTDTYCVDNDSNLLADIADYNTLGLIPREEFRKSLVKGNRIAALTVVMRTSVLRATGLYDNNYITEDFFRWLKINEVSYITYIPEKLAYYRIHGENISQQRNAQIEEDVLRLQLSFDKGGLCKDIIRRKLTALYSQNISINRDIITAYALYPGKSKRLSMALSKRIPFSVYKIINQIF